MWQLRRQIGGKRQVVRQSSKQGDWVELRMALWMRSTSRQPEFSSSIAANTVTPPA